MSKLSEEQFQAVARALADPRRFAILEQIAAVPAMACSTLREQQIISPATISHHVKELNEAGLIRIEREGRGATLILCQAIMDAYLERLSRLTASGLAASRLTSYGLSAKPKRRVRQPSNESAVAADTQVSD